MRTPAWLSRLFPKRYREIEEPPKMPPSGTRVSVFRGPIPTVVVCGRCQGMIAHLGAPCQNCDRTIEVIP